MNLEFQSLSTEQSKPFNEISALEYLEGHESLVYRFLNERIRKRDHAFILEQMLDDAVFTANLIKLNYTLSESEKINKVIEMLCHEGYITVELGAKRHGKTAGFWWFVEQALQLKIKVVWYGYSSIVRNIYPEVDQVLDLTKIEKCVLGYDEVLLSMLGRDAMTTDSKDKIRQLPTIGHRDASVIFMSQSLRVDPMILNLCDAIWFKPFFAMEYDRDTFNKMKRVVRHIMPKHKDENILYDMHTSETIIFRNPLPARWSEDLSKPFKRIQTKKEAEEYYEMLLDAGFSQRETDIMLKQRGWRIEDFAL